jgi:hypothetical protein
MITAPRMARMIGPVNQANHAVTEAGIVRGRL